jgi:drug/metabolite transporter (DMT)-like permease
MTSELAAVVFGLLASAGWGSGDFSGGLATRRMSVFSVVAISHAIGPFLLVALALLSGETLPASGDLLWGALAGLAGVVGLAGLYRGLAIGQAGVVAPVSAVLAAGIPVLFTAVTRALPDGLQFVGFALGIMGIWLVSGTTRAAGKPNGLQMGLIAGVGFGVFFILLDQIAAGAVFWPLAAARSASGLAMLTLVRVRGLEWRPPSRGTLGLVLLAGVLDIAANAFFVLATQSGRLDIAAVVSSLYPAVTVLLARVVLREYITRGQYAGIGCGLAAVILIAVG